MSCWVVPAIAAEFWGIPLDTVLQRVHAGQVASKHEEGFTFVDVLPGRPVHPPTYRHSPALPAGATDDADELPSLDEASENFTDWRSARLRSSLLRQRPAA